MVQSKGETVPRTNRWDFAMYIGFFAGLIWGGIKIIEHYFHFTTLSPGFLIEPFFQAFFLIDLAGDADRLVIFILFSIVASLLYTVLLAKARGPWFGIGYGIFWWAMFFLLIGPITGMTHWLLYMDLNTILTDACLFVLWGLFIGYSVSFEFNDESAGDTPKPDALLPEPD